MEQTFNKAIDLIYLAKQNGVEIVLNENRLQLKVAENKDIDKSLLAEVRDNKQLLIDFLSNENWRSTTVADNHNKITRFNRDALTPIPLSFSQERLWFIDQLEGSLQYNSPSVLRLKGKLNREALQYALRSIINRHEVLRSVMREEGGKVYQYIQPQDGWNLSIVDGLMYAEDPTGLQAYIRSVIVAPFDLSKDYMLRAHLIMLCADEHVLVVTMHHIAADAWSIPIIVQEVVELYSAFDEERADKLIPLDLQYADFAFWQRNYLQGETLNKKISYWKQKLEGLSPLQLSADYPRPAIRTTRGASSGFRIDKELSANLRGLSQQEGTTLFMTLLAAFKLLLSRYSGQSDISVGTSIANRSQQEISGLVGFFVNTLALRDEINADATFSEFLQQVKITTLEAYEHQDIPFEKVVETVVKDRDPGSSPLFQVMLVLLNTPESSKLQFGEVELIQEPFESNISKFDLTFFVTESVTGLSVSVVYSTDLFKETTIERMMGDFAKLLSSVIKSPHQKVGRLAMLTAEEEQELIQKFTSRVTYPKDKSIIDLFEDEVTKSPGNTAAVFEGKILSYQQLNERSNQLAHYLKSRGVKEESLVPLYLERGIDMLIGILGIMKAGAAYVPIDTDFPAERIRYMLEDTQARWIVSSRESSVSLPTVAGIGVIEVENIVDQPKENLNTRAGPNSLSYVIYTSGSTGKPKGVMVEHRSLVDYVFGLKARVQLQQCNSFALVSSIATDLGNTVIFGSLVTGGALHLFSKETVSNIEVLQRYFVDHSIDCLKIVPSHWKALCTTESLLLPKKLLVFGGEALQAEFAEDIHLSGSSCTVINHYGPTETTIGKLLHEVSKKGTYQSAIPIGRPFSNTRVYILTSELQLCPAGVPGQLYISGDGVARGYWNNKELTREKFIKDPFSTGAEDRMYGTGDLVKSHADGEIFFIGRVDDQVKIRGYRIELGEIESVLQQNESVRQAVVLAREDKQGNKRLIAYIVSDGWFDKEGIISWLKDKLPDYMIPSLLMEFESLPLLANGKIDRKSLPDPEVALDAQYIAPRNATELMMAEIWQNVLEVDRVGVEDDFFELGGHSLLAVRLISAIRKAFAVEMPISDVFDYPTVASLAGQVNNQSGAMVLPAIEAIQPRPERIPLSFSQERLWFIDRLEGSIQYHVPTVFRLKGKLNLEALSYALQNLVNRHEVLRTLFLEEDGRAYQYIMDKDAWQLSVIDGSLFKGDVEALQRKVQQLVLAPFDLSNDYMIRVHLIKLDDQEHVLVVTLHHIASDGWSKSVLVKEVVEGYSSFEEHRPLNLVALPIQYADYAIWQRNYLDGEVLNKKLGYWKQKLEEVPPLQLPTDYPRPAIQSTRGALKSFIIDQALTDQLQALSQKQGTTLFMTLLAAFKVLLYRYSGQEDICVGTPIAGRQQQNLEELIGFFVNTLALRSQVTGDSSFAELLQDIKATMLEAYENQEVPFEKVVDAVVKDRDLGRNPLFQVMLVLRNTPEVPELNLGEVQLSREGHEITTTLFDITFFITETPYGMKGVVEYCTDLFSKGTVERMIDHFRELLSSIVKIPQQKIGALPMLSVEDERQLLVAFNNTSVSYPRNKTIISLFEEQVLKTPEALAVIHDEEKLTYQELNDRSNQLAHYLKGKGVKEEVLVSVCIDRTIEMIVAILGILKAGGAYVPIDPEYPAERISYMLQDTKSSLVVSNKRCRTLIPAFGELAIIELDTEWPIIKSQPAHNLLTEINAHHLAYIIYTSGSTGKPKGVMIEHGNVYSFISWCRQEFSSSSFEIVYAGTSICFDLSIFEIFYPLSIGKHLRIIENGLYIGKYLPYDSKVLTNSVPAAIQNLLKDGIDLSNISVMNMAGEPIPPQVQQSLDADKTEIRNLYGPTEDTTYSTVYRLKNGAPLLIGRPVNNTQVFILNHQMKLVPVGVAGEICLGGAGVARGYLNREELTEEKFVVNPFSSEPGERLYKTGDLGRWLPDGNLEYLGRLDDQVKIRGYRIELGEIETMLVQSEMVKEAVVLARQSAEGSKSLVGYIVPDWASVKTKERELYSQQVTNWKELYEAEYEQTEEDQSLDPEFNIIGWNDSFTGVPIAADQMKDWLKDIVEIIMSGRPGNVLEIGCGTGLIYYQLAGKVKKYIGTDFSQSSINQIKRRISKNLREYGPTDLQVCAAHEISISEDQQVDTVLINSVVQYFPGEDYLGDVINKSIGILKGKGRIIIGDVRDNRLLGLFKSRLLLQKLQDSVSIKEFKWAVDQEILKEEELCFSPEYFYRLQTIFPQITHVEIQGKQSSYINELTLYRYNVVIYVGIHIEATKPEWQNWKDVTSQQITLELGQGTETIALKDVPNHRLSLERLMSDSLAHNTAGTVGDIVQAIRKEDTEGIEIEKLLGIAGNSGYHCRLLLDEDPLKLNILMELTPSGNFVKQVYSDKEFAGNVLNTNIPLFANISSLLLNDIRVLMQQRLPEYMVPSELFILAHMPLTANGKVDRKFLSERQDKTTFNKLNYEAPRTEVEQVLVNIWQELLHIDRVGIYDNFFEMGGHSLLATRVISAVRRRLNVELSIKDLFVHSTIAGLAGLLSDHEKGLVLPAIEVYPRPEHLPLSFSQERLWFIDRLEGSVQYHVPAVLRLKGNLNKEALVHTLKSVVNRHEVLRTVIRELDGRPYQYIMEQEGWELTMVDGSLYQNDPDKLLKYIDTLKKHPFNLSKDYMFRAHLIVLNQSEHVLVVILHHIASDGWSRSVLVKEVAELYNSYDQNRANQLAPLKIQYADYAVWQRNNLQGDLLDKKLGYWKTKLEDVQVLGLPTDFVRPAVQSTRGDMVSFSIDKGLSAQLQALSHQQGGTLFMTLLSAFKILLYRYSRQNDICVGTAIAGRQSEELEALIGFFVNTLALRSEVNGNVTFTGLLQQVKQTTLEAYGNQEVPFEKVVEAIVGDRNLGTDPLVQVMFSLQNTPDVPVLQIGNTRLSQDKYEDNTALFELWLNIVETPGGLKGAVIYSTDLYSEATMERFVAHFSKLLASIASDPNGKIATLEMMSGTERHQLLEEFNDNIIPYPAEKNIITLFREQVQEHPGNVALIFEDQQLTYLELHERSNQFAHYLHSMGIGNGTLVPICLHRSPELIIAILAILKVGGAYVPIDPEYPLERISYMLEDTAAGIIVSNRDNKSKLGRSEKIKIVEIGSEWTSIRNEAIIDIQTDIPATSVAYVIYTSGSTGNPKGTIVAHSNVISLVKGIDYVSLTENDILLSTGSPSFDATTFEYWGMLLNGGQLVLCTQNTLLDIELLKREIISRKVTKMWFTSSWFNQLVETDITIFKSLQTILAGGEKLSEQHVQKFRQTYPGIELINGYGPTENTTFSLTYRITETNIIAAIPIGRALNNRSAYIVDEFMRLVPIGVPGEILLGGAGLALGYLNRPGLTAEKFIASPFGKNVGATLYKTGDIGKWLQNGTIEYIKRLDDQVKVRGYRIELGEVETAMNKLEQVNTSCVVVKNDVNSTGRLVGYYTPDWGVVKAKERELYTGLIAGWKELYEIEYSKTEVAENINHEFNIIGWQDSFTGDPIKPEEMQEWLQDIMAVIMSGKPEYVLEIGSGTGLIYYQLAGKIKKYIGTDFSRSSVNQITERVKKGLRDYGPTELHVCAAHEVSLKDDEKVDTVILNSIVQYFPGEDYMTDVIGKSISFLKGKGRIIVGDVRDNRLLELFKGRLQIRKLYESVSVKEFSWLLEQEVFKEEELCFSPDYFYKLQALYPGITHIEIKWKQGSFINELTLYRFTVIIYVGIEAPVLKPGWQSWNDLEDKKVISVQFDQGLTVALKDVPNPRLWQERLLQDGLQDKSAKNVGDLLHTINKVDAETEEVTAILAEAYGKGYSCRFLLHEDPLKVNVVFEQIPSNSFVELPSRKSNENLSFLSTNIPLFNDINSLFQTDIRYLLQQSLPDYMVPSEIIALGQLPLTNNGKIDRIFLREREDRGQGNKLNYVPPRNETEQALSEIWQEMLKVKRVGIHDNFFELGGHSLLVMRLVSAINKKMNLVFSISDVFIYPTIAGLAGIISQKGKELEPSVNLKYLVTLKAGSSRKPALYIVCGGGGTALRFRKFAEMLDEGQPVYVLQPPVKNDLKEFPDTVEEIAYRFIEEILLINPTGPYALSGHCTGGIVAFEMAKQLEAMGKKIHLLAMFDSIIRVRSKRQQPTLKNFYQIPLLTKEVFSRIILKIDFETFLLRKHTKQAIRYKVNSLKKAIGKNRKRRGRLNEVEYDGLEIFNESMDLYATACKNYNLKPYDKEIILYYAKDHYYFLDKGNNIGYKKLFINDETKNMWKQYSRSISIYEIDGEHSSIFEAVHGNKFAQSLQKQLNKPVKG